MTKTQTLETLLAALTVGGRMNPEKSRAQPWHMYQNPEKHVKLGGKKEVTVERISDREKADTLLIEWYRWTKAYRPNLGAPKIAPYCREASISRQYDSESTVIEDKVYQNEMKAVDFCVDAIEVSMQQAIGKEMKNREVNAKVWRSPSNKTYEDALLAILPVMRKRGLFD